METRAELIFIFIEPPGKEEREVLDFEEISLLARSWAFLAFSFITPTQSVDGFPHTES